MQVVLSIPPAVLRGDKHHASFGGAPPAPLVGPARPAFKFHDSDFWAQGLNVGVAFRF